MESSGHAVIGQGARCVEAGRARVADQVAAKCTNLENSMLYSLVCELLVGGRFGTFNVKKHAKDTLRTATKFA